MRVVFGFLGALLLGLSSGQKDPFDYNMSLQATERTNVCDKDKICVLPHECVNGKINRFGIGTIVSRSDFSKCEVPNVCCSKAEAQTNVSPTPNCGSRNITIGGANPRGKASFDEFPWLLQLRDATMERFYCAASLIHPQIALTAAHCVADLAVNEIRVLAGELNVTPTQRSVSEKVVHRKFNSANLRYDIALLFLTQPFILHRYINTVCLPPPNLNPGFISCFGTGWGSEDGTSNYSSLPKKIVVPTEEHATCETALQEDGNLTTYFRLHKSFLCAGAEDRDLCKGDGGGPLSCPIREKRHNLYQLGIVSWGLGCGKSNVPGVYASLPYFRNWVDKQVTGRNFGIEYYTPN